MAYPSPPSLINITSKLQGIINIPLFLPVYSLTQWSGVSISGGTSAFAAASFDPMLTSNTGNLNSSNPQFLTQLNATILAPATTSSINLLGRAPSATAIYSSYGALAQYQFQLGTIPNTYANYNTGGGYGAYYGNGLSISIPFGQTTSYKNLPSSPSFNSLYSANSALGAGGVYLINNSNGLLTAPVPYMGANILGGGVVNGMMMMPLDGGAYNGFNGYVVPWYNPPGSLNNLTTHTIGNYADFTVAGDNYFLMSTTNIYPNNYLLYYFNSTISQYQSPLAQAGYQPITPYTLSVITFDNASIQSIFNGYNGSTAYLSHISKAGFVLSSQSVSTLVPGQRAIIILSKDGTKYWVLRFIPQNSAANTLFNTIYGYPFVGIDQSNYVYILNGNNMSQLLTSFSTSLPFGLSLYLDNSRNPAYSLPCFSSCD